MKRELVNKSQTVAKRQAKQMLDHCMNHFSFSKTMKQDADLLFIQLIYNPHFYRGCLKTKMILSGVCTYLVMSKFDLVITKNAIAKVIGCTVSLISRFNNFTFLIS